MLNFKEREENLDTELNIVPIIDCFVMLICFLLFTAAFTQLVFLEAKFAAATAAAAEKSRSELDQFRLLVTMEDRGLRLEVSGSKTRGEKGFYPLTNGDYDYAAIHRAVLDLKIKYPERYALDLEVKSRKAELTRYEKIMAVIDSVRHLNDKEFGELRIVQKRQRNLMLTEMEEKQVIDEHITKLSQSLASNEISAQADQKVLFADVALLGVN